MHNNNNNSVIIHHITELNWNNYLPLLYDLIQRKTNKNGQYQFYAGVSDKAHNVMTSFLYSGVYS